MRFLATGFDLNANLAAILTLISAITAASVSVIASIKANKKQNFTNEKLDVIHQQTNGTLSAKNEEIASLKAQVEQLTEVNKRMTGDRRV